MSLSLLEYFPYEEPREIQTQALRALESAWDDYDVFVLQAPTAFGKSAIAKTIMTSLHSVTYLAPTNLLVDQFLEEFPDTPSLKRLDSYRCEKWLNNCASTRGREKGFCKGCPAAKDLARAKYRKGPGAYNYHIHGAHKLHREVLIVDEAHNLIPHITDRFALKLWQHDVNYPSGAWTYPQLLEWLRGLPAPKQRLKKQGALHAALTARNPEYIVQRTTDSFNGKGTIRGQPEERDLLKLLPVDIRNVPKLFWPSEVKKIVLLSATINKKDIEALGLGGRKVLYLECNSPIPTPSRPILLQGVTSVSRANIEEAAGTIGKYIQNELAPHHAGEKGVVHATYQLAHLLKRHLTNGRFIFHDRHNKAERYQEFIQSDPMLGKVLVASGLYEGIDLPGDLGRWQVIAKVPWASLGNPAVKHLADKDPEWYNWQTLRTLIQAAGRICRTPEDFGVTYVVDKSVGRLFQEAQHLMPQWFQEAVVYED